MTYDFAWLAQCSGLSCEATRTTRTIVKDGPILRTNTTQIAVCMRRNTLTAISNNIIYISNNCYEFELLTM